MKILISIFGVLLMLSAPAIAQDNNQAAETETPAEAEGEVEAPTSEEVDEAVKVINSIAEDKQKAQGYCDIAMQMDDLKEGEETKAEELGTKMDEYLTGLGENVADAFSIAEVVDPESEDGQKIDVAFGKLYEQCGS